VTYAAKRSREVIAIENRSANSEGDGGKEEALGDQKPRAERQEDSAAGSGSAVGKKAVGIKRHTGIPTKKKER